MRAIVAGYEMAEAMTDQCPSTGRLESNGAESGDTCAWISSGQGAALKRGQASFQLENVLQTLPTSLTKILGGIARLGRR
jgi:hypothetical protein